MRKIIFFVFLINLLSINTVFGQETKSATLMAVGDIMMHQSQINGSFDKKTNTYNFDNFFVNIKPILEQGDVVYGNLETPVAGSKLKYSGYPSFNAPNTLLDALKTSFFTHLSLANNHTNDRGVTGIYNTAVNVYEQGFVGIGVHDNKLNPNYRISEVNGIRIGYLAYTYGTNGNRLPKKEINLVSIIDKKVIVQDLEALKNEKVDVIVVGLHFGDEYKTQENKFQQDIAKLACDNGANIVLGSHPHVLQPIRFLNDKNCLVAFSLGNFISGMSLVYTDVAGILKIDINITDNKVELVPDFIGTWVKRDFNKNGTRSYTVLPINETDIPKHIIVNQTEKKRLTLYRDFINKKIKKY